MTASLQAASPSAFFEAWAEVYDDQPNPILALEERELPRLLPAIAGASILDVGCGTGRWLQRLEAQSPLSVTGCDSSPAMLQRARQKISAATVLHLGAASSLPCFDNSCDLILASFVLGYVDDLSGFAAECARVLKPGGHVFLSDLHPITATQQGWTRSYKAEQGGGRLVAHSRLLPDIVASFAEYGFNLSSLEEPSFDIPERFIFVQANKLADYEKLGDLPAIYLLGLRKKVAETRATVVVKEILELSHAPWSIHSQEWSSDSLLIEDAKVRIGVRSAASDLLDLSGYVLLPGLINAHDHLEFALFPNLGRPPHAAPYYNAVEWANEIHQGYADLIDLHLQVPLDTRLWWGAIRNLLCGVTTVCHHNPIHPALTSPDFPVDVVRDFGWSHSLTFGSNLAEAHRATPEDQPYILHAAEGTDGQSRDEIFELDRLHLLDKRTVVVHGLALTMAEIDLLNDRGAALVLCPTSNLFLFHQTPPASHITAVHRIALGSDSPLTSSGDLLDEVQFLVRSHSVDPVTLFDMVTSNPAAILKITRGQGRIAPGDGADLIAVRDRHVSPAQTMAALTFAEVELVLLGGRVQLASPALYARLSDEQRKGLHLLEVAGHQRWLRAPVPALFASAEHVLGPGKLRLGNKEVRCCSIR